MAAICILVVDAIVDVREAAFDTARMNASNVSAGFAERVRLTLSTLEGASDLIEQDFQQGRPFDVHKWRAELPRLLSPAIGIAVSDDDGRLVASTWAANADRAPLLDAATVAAHRAEESKGLRIGAPRPVGHGRSIIPISRRLSRQDGTFAGVLTFLVDPARQTELHRKVDLGRTGSLTLLGEDGLVLARYSSDRGGDQARLGERFPSLATLGADGASQGSFVRKSALDGISRIYYWRKIQGYPLIAEAGLGEDESLAGANYQARVVVGLGLIALCLPLAMMGILHRQLAQRVRDAAALDEESQKFHAEHTALLSITEELARERIKLKKMNEELAASTQRAEEASHAKSAFLANMSHELRTPLNAILGFSEVIRDRLFGDDTERYASYAADINRAGAHLLSAVNAILDITKVEAGKLDLNEEEVELESVVEEVFRAVAQQSRENGVRLSRLVPDRLLCLYGDAHKLRQILVNVLSNAIKFTPCGGFVELAVLLHDDGSLDFRVRDTGIGMSSAEIEKALELFNQVDGYLAKRFEGTGLGLPLAVQLAERHGGSLKVQSAAGEGTVVTVHLPAWRVRVCEGRTRRLPHDGGRVGAFDMAS